MKPDGRLFGQSAESIADEYLRKKGYRIIDRNVRSPSGELDLVARLGDTVVFIEVKARRTEKYGGVSYSINRRKEQRIIKLAAQYLAKHHLHGQPCRFDVILCKGGQTAPIEIEHIEDAFEVTGEDLRW